MRHSALASWMLLQRLLGSNNSSNKVADYMLLAADMFYNDVIVITVMGLNNEDAFK